MFTSVTWPRYFSRSDTVSCVATTTARKSGAGESTPTTPPLPACVRVHPPATSARTIPPASIHCFDILGLRGAGAPKVLDGCDRVGLAEDRLTGDEGIGPR